MEMENFIKKYGKGGSTIDYEIDGDYTILVGKTFWVCGQNGKVILNSLRKLRKRFSEHGAYSNEVFIQIIENINMIDKGKGKVFIIEIYHNNVLEKTYEYRPPKTYIPFFQRLFRVKQ